MTGTEAFSSHYMYIPKVIQRVLFPNIRLTEDSELLTNTRGHDQREENLEGTHCPDPRRSPLRTRVAWRLEALHQSSNLGIDLDTGDPSHTFVGRRGKPPIRCSFR